MSILNNSSECSQIYRDAFNIKQEITFIESEIPNLRNRLDAEIAMNTQTFLENGKLATIIIPTSKVQELRDKITLYENSIPSNNNKLNDLYQQSRANGCLSFP